MFSSRILMDSCLTSRSFINLKFIFVYGVREVSIKILEENIGNNLYDIGQSNLFHDTSPKARETKDKMNLWDFIKKKASAEPRKQPEKLRGSPRNGRRYLQMTLQIKDWYPRSTKNFSNSITRNK